MSNNRETEIILAYWVIDGGDESDLKRVKRIFDNSNEERKAFLLSMIKKYGSSSIPFDFLVNLFWDEIVDYNKIEKRCSSLHRRSDKKIDLAKLWTSRDMNEEEIMYLNEMMDGENGIHVKGLIRKYGANIVYRALMNNKTDSEFDWIQILNECTEKKKEIEQEVKEEIIPDFCRTNDVKKNYNIYLNNIELLNYLKYALYYYGFYFTKADYLLHIEWNKNDDHTMFDYLELNKRILERVMYFYKKDGDEKEDTSDDYFNRVFENFIPWIFYERKNKDDIDLEDILEIYSNPRLEIYDTGIEKNAKMFMEGIDKEDDRFKKLLLLYETFNFRKESALKYLGNLNVENTTVLGVTFNEWYRLIEKQVFKPQSFIPFEIKHTFRCYGDRFFERLKDRTEEYRNNNKPNRIIPVENIPDATIQIVNALEYEESVKVYYIKYKEDNTQVDVVPKDKNSFIEKVFVKKDDLGVFYIAIGIRDREKQITNETEGGIKPSGNSRTSNDER